MKRGPTIPGTMLVAAALASGCSDEAVEPIVTPTPPFVSGSRLRARVLDGGGGAVVLQDWHDSELDERCRFRPATDGRWRCLPDDEDSYVYSTVNDIMYLDAACKQAVRVVATDAPRVPRYVLGEPGAHESCNVHDPPSPVHELGEELHPAELYWRLDGCELDGPVMNMRVFALGAELSPSALVAGDVVHEPRSEALAATLFAAEDGTREVTGTFDSGRAAECWTMFTPSGPCVPTRIAWSVGDYADAACTEPTAYTSELAPGGPASVECAAPEIVIAYTDHSCGVEMSFFEVGAPVAAVYRVVDDSCTPAADPDHADFGVGAPVPASAFPVVGTTDLGSGRLRARHSAIGGVPVRAVGPEFVDTDTSTTCSPIDLCEGRTICLPNHPSSALYFADAACEGDPLVLIGTNTECPEPVPAVHVDLTAGAGECIAGGRTNLVGEVVAPSAVWRVDSVEGCVPGLVDEGPGYSYRRLGEEVAWSTFATIERRTE